jgi:NADH:ubiquinone oxidoreductase subunit 4 (subunit M)
MNTNNNKNSAFEFQSQFLFEERRKKSSDWIAKMSNILSLVSWLIAFSVWMIAEMAQPDRENFWHGIARIQGHQIELNTTWNTVLLQIAFNMLTVSLLMCVTAFIFNKLRMRRKTDKYKKSIWVIAAITIAVIIYFIINFGNDVLWWNYL